jgi:hypothetical protein
MAIKMFLEGHERNDVLPNNELSSERHLLGRCWPWDNFFTEVTNLFILNLCLQGGSRFFILPTPLCSLGQPTTGGMCPTPCTTIAKHQGRIYSAHSLRQSGIDNTRWGALPPEPPWLYFTNIDNILFCEWNVNVHAENRKWCFSYWFNLI